MSRVPETPATDAGPAPGLEIPIFHGLVQLSRILLRYKWLVLTTIASCIGMVVLYFYLIPPSYSSEAQILVVHKRPRAMPIPGVAPQLAIFQDSLTSHQALLTSRLIGQRALDEGNLTSLETFVDPSEKNKGKPPSPIITFIRWLRSLGPTTKPRPFDAVDVLLDGLEVERETQDAALQDRSFAIFKLEFACKTEDDCAAVLAAVIEAYGDYLDENERDDSDEIRELFVQWNEEIQQDVARRQKEYLTQLSQVEPLQWQSEGGINLSEQRVAEIANQRLALLVQVSQDRERLDALRKAREEGVSNEVLFELVTEWTTAAARETNARSQLFNLLLREKELVRTYGEQHREVEAIRDQIQLAAAQVFGPEVEVSSLELLDPVSVYSQSLARNLAVSEAMSEAMESLMDGEHSLAKDAHVLNEKLAQYRADVEIARRLQIEVVNKLQELDVVKNSEFIEAELLTPPTPARLTFLSNPILMFALSLVGGTLLAIGLALLADTLSRRFRTPGDLERRLRVGILGHVPYRRNWLRRWFRRGGVDADMVVHYAPDSVAAEAYRALRSTLLYLADKDRYVVQITSTRAGEGSATVAANLAASIARVGKRVLLIDADYHQRELERLLNLSSDDGLAKLLVGEVEFDDVIQEGGVDGLSVLPGGPAPEHAADLLSSPRFGRVLETGSERYDVVIIAAPPLLAASDALCVAAQTDGLVVTARNDRSAQSRMAQALECARSVGARILGLVIVGDAHFAGREKFGYDVTPRLFNSRRRPGQHPTRRHLSTNGSRFSS
jgi:capsular exopolysaccharide synthesis family protein